MAAEWVSRKFDGSAYRFLVAADWKLRLVGWICWLSQMLALMTIYFVLIGDEISDECDNSDTFKCSDGAAWLCVGILAIFLVSWLATDCSRVYACLRPGWSKGEPLLGIAVLLVTLTGGVSCIVFAVKEGAAGGAQNLVLESVTVLLILDLDEKMFEAMQVWIGSERLEGMMERTATASEC